MPNQLIPKVELIAIDLIDVINPRERSKRTFKEIVQNIRDVGLKRPITVARRSHPTGVRYELICGQGRLEAYQQLGQHEIPALIREAETEDCFVMSLVENIARRNLRAIELLRDIGDLKQRGYTEAQVAAKTGLSLDFVRGATRLLEQGELRLLQAVEAGNIPLTVAVEIAEAADADVQQALQRAYEATRSATTQQSCANTSIQEGPAWT
jgi:ParB family chromosome partitioning protein